MRPADDAPPAAGTPVLGIVLMVAITVALVVTAVASVQRARLGDEPPAQFERGGDGSLELVDPQGAESWSDFAVVGCDVPAGTADVGDRLEECEGEVKVVDLESGEVVFEGDFPAAGR